eukprot:CAMPEP_0172301476 /NCGR_PEP_ID=MMETSP1058-20130122/3360_1 /TAXON_ID=83371 /ORGANISM="Detonula confervacea, Strain CCMP 353" /LENGTH=480 /DNA_ID=CAMNT_0013011611 /DNA_START=187 /DNA_END=1629 /DNA_ORIENTATION=+
MPCRIAISYLLLLQQLVNAFQATPNYYKINNAALSLKQKQPSILHTAALESIPTLESILDDGHGHINSNLAQAIYEWEVAHNDNDARQVNDKQFSTRDGLRLVDELAREILSSIGIDGIDNNEDDANNVNGRGRGDDENDDSNGGSGGIASRSSSPNSRKSSGGISSYNDLVQEGMIALMRAMSTYDNYKMHTTASNMSSFEEYAKQSIQTSFLHFLAHSSRPIRLPLSLQTTLQTANIAADKLRQTLGKEPSLVQVAKEVNIAPEQLALYRKLHRTMVSRVGTFVSVEDGMEVYDPTLAGVGVGTGLRARRDWSVGRNTNGNDVGGENVEGRTSSAGASLSDNSNAITNEQDLTQLNSQEDNWTREPPERIVAPLKDVLTDTEELNNPLSYMHHHLLNEELNEFLLETLTKEELTVIQLRFGLVDSKYGGKGWTAKDIGQRLDMDHEDVVRVASTALDKLRKASSNLEEDNDAYVEISL